MIMSHDDDHQREKGIRKVCLMRSRQMFIIIASLIIFYLLPHLPSVFLLSPHLFFSDTKDMLMIIFFFRMRNKEGWE